MDQNTPVQSKQSSVEMNVTGKQFYSPATIGAYCILTSFLVGIALYAVNLTRRGEVWMGRLLIGLVAIIGVGLTIAEFLGRNAFGRAFWLLSILVALALVQMEKGPFKRALANGATRAKWWPPLLWVILLVVVEIAILLFIQTDAGL